MLKSFKVPKFGGLKRRKKERSVQPLTINIGLFSGSV